MSTLGLDLSSLDDIDDTRTVSELELVAQDAFWRLQTPRGAGVLASDAPDYGIDLLDAIGSAETEADAASLPERIRAEMTKDERITKVDATVVRVVTAGATSYDIRIDCETGSGPFSLVGTATDLALDLSVKLIPEAT